MATEAQNNPGAPRSGPSDSLMAVFRACSRDPTTAIEERLRRMQHLFLRHMKNSADGPRPEVLVQCCCQAETWFYRILENLIKQERRRLGTFDVSSLLENDLVQRCLAACCLEVTMCSTRLPSDFPVLLHVFRLAPYHFWRVIELVVRRADVPLPHAVVRHLDQLDQKVVESLAWTGDSALWEDVRAEGRLPTCQQVVPPSRLEVNADGNPPGGGAARAPRGSKPLHLFARKVYSLMGRRLRELCSALRIGDELRLQIWTCLEHALVHCTALMRDRHLDQMMMCSIYIMAKITKKEIPFKDIMKCYKSQPHADKGVCKNVLISGDEDKSQTENHITDGGGHSSEFLTPNTPSAHYPVPSAHYPVPSPQQRSDLIHFYNHDYTAKMQDFATLFVPASGGDTPPLSPYPQQRPSPRRHRLSGSRRVFVTSLTGRETPPRRAAGLSYVFSSTPSERLREINHMIRASGAQRRSRAGPDGAGPPARRPRLDQRSAWHRRLADIAGERVAGRNREQAPPDTEL